jgi:hypothetical protein
MSSGLKSSSGYDASGPVHVIQRASVCFATQHGITVSRPWGKLMLTVLGMLAESYIDNLRQETRKGKVQRARDGLWNGSIPLGYCNGLCSKCADLNGPGYCPEVGQPDKTDGKLLIPHPIESFAVKLAFDWYVTGQFTDGQIAQKLNAYPHFAPDGSLIQLRTKGTLGRFQPGPFTKDAVRDLLQRRFYTGQLVYRGVDEQGRRRRRKNITDTFQGQQPVLIEPIVCDKAQEGVRPLHSLRARSTVSPPGSIHSLASSGVPCVVGPCAPSRPRDAAIIETRHASTTSETASNSRRTPRKSKPRWLIF